MSATSCSRAHRGAHDKPCFVPPADDTPTAAAVAQRLWAFQAGASTTPVPAFLFHHLPKTGGSKVDGILKQHWRRVLGQNFSCHGQGLPAGGIPACEIQPFDPRSRCRATCSNYHTPPSEFPRPCDATAADSGLEVVTLLRHPYDARLVPRLARGRDARPPRASALRRAPTALQRDARARPQRLRGRLPPVQLVCPFACRPQILMYFR